MMRSYCDFLWKPFELEDDDSKCHYSDQKLITFQRVLTKKYVFTLFSLTSVKHVN